MKQSYLKGFWILEILLNTIYFVSCNFTHNADKIKKPIHYVSTNSNYRRDSLYVATTIWQFIDKKVDIFDYYKQYNIPLNKVRVDVDTIIYSPDTLKLFSFVIITVPDYENKKPDRFYYSGEDMIGYRFVKNQPWSIYYFGQIRPTGVNDYNDVRNIFRNYYLGQGKFKNSYATYWDGIRNDTLGMARSITFPAENNRVNIKFGYNVDDTNFWNKSIVWKKGSRIPKYYSFETIGNVAPGYTDSPIIRIPHLDYPDSLINEYSKKSR